MDRFSDCLFLTGPTASGKSEVGLEIASRLDAEIVALDSMTLYRRLDIGTAKPDAEARQRIRHHLIDVLDPWEPASLDWYLQQAEAACGEIRTRGKVPLFVGGTPLYLKACLRGIFEGPPADQSLRSRLESQAAEHGIAWLHGQLAQVDPAAAERISPNDLRRIVRALEVYELTGIPISEQQQQFKQPAANPPLVACLSWPTEQLYDRINRRVLQMLEQGWIEEVARLRSEGVPFGKEASQAAGYKEILEYLAGDRGYDDMVQKIQTRTRQLSKRQRTWFRHIDECQMVETTQDEPIHSLVHRVESIFETRISKRNS